MKKYIISLLLLFTFCQSAFCQSSIDIVKSANKEYDLGHKENAKKLYLKAAAMNNADAHFYLAYKYYLNYDERVYHFSEAAKMGHQEALKYILEELFFRADDLNKSNPELAYEIYKIAIKKNPKITDEYINEYIETIKKCLEAGPFDKKAFMTKYKIKENEVYCGYAVWELASKLSKRKGKEKISPKLLLQLIARGGSVPAELIAAVDFAYDNWKKNKVEVFELCDFVTSSYGMSYCSGKYLKIANKEYKKRIIKLKSTLNNDASEILQQTFDIASKFFESKASNEELNGGSWYIFWTRESIMSQKYDYLDLIEKVNTTFNKDSIVATANSDKKLNLIYKKVIKRLKKSAIKDSFAEVNVDGMRSVQKLWIKYRDSTALLFSKINPSISEQEWSNWLTTVRIKQLREVLELPE